MRGSSWSLRSTGTAACHVTEVGGRGYSRTKGSSDHDGRSGGRSEAAKQGTQAKADPKPAGWLAQRTVGCEVDAGGDHYWMNDAGEYFTTDDGNYDPNTDPGLYDQNWQQLEDAPY